MPKALKNLPPVAFIAECMDCPKETGVAVFRERPLHHFQDAPGRKAVTVWRNWNNRFAGKVAGCVNGGRVRIKLGCTSYYLHRLIWKLHHGEDPVEIDHKDGDPLNNRSDNLRSATYAENARNRRCRRDNVSGSRGVTKESNGYRVRIEADGRRFFLGIFNTIEEARAAYRGASVVLHGAFARNA